MESPNKKTRRRQSRKRTIKAKASISKDLFDDHHSSPLKFQQNQLRLVDTYRPDYSSHNLHQPATPSRRATHSNHLASPKSDNRYVSRTIRPHLKSGANTPNNSPLKNKTTSLQTLLALHKQCQQEEAQILVGIRAMHREKKEAENQKLQNSYRGTIDPPNGNLITGFDSSDTQNFRFDPSIPEFIPKPRIQRGPEGPRIKKESTDHPDCGLSHSPAKEYQSLPKGFEQNKSGGGIKAQHDRNNRKQVPSSDLTYNPFIDRLPRPRIKESDWGDLFEKHPCSPLGGIENRRNGTDCLRRAQEKSTSHSSLEQRVGHVSFGSH